MVILCLQRSHFWSIHLTMMKRCTDCGNEKSLDLFSNFKHGRLGKKPHCKDCGARQTKEWVANNRSKKMAMDAAYRKENRSKITAYKLQNREKHLSDMKAWHAKNWSEESAAEAAERARSYRANPDNLGLINAWSSARRAREIQATPSWANKKAIEAFYIEAARLSKLTGIPHHVDHIYPLKSKWMCGLHVETNLQILTKAENLKKSNSTPQDAGYVTSSSTRVIATESAN